VIATTPEGRKAARVAFRALSREERTAELQSAIIGTVSAADAGYIRRTDVAPDAWQAPDGTIMRTGSPSEFRIPGIFTKSQRIGTDFRYFLSRVLPLYGEEEDLSQIGSRDTEACPALQEVASPSLSWVQTDCRCRVPRSTPFIITPAMPGASRFGDDLGVLDVGWHLMLTRISEDDELAPGTYRADDAGRYEFHPSAAGRETAISYWVVVTP
jgi:hypothetical protein